MTVAGAAAAGGAFLHQPPVTEKLVLGIGGSAGHVELPGLLANQLGDPVGQDRRELHGTLPDVIWIPNNVVKPGW
ncbi:hypothetical protein ACGF12_32360 [Kitasatospora sp. NPDC048296]|uniref:hypothetical protein n=1 Tax=Kitasatospora sp. NPDC048296 TaxID=3364048 RepID=UPI00371786A4